MDSETPPDIKKICIVLLPILYQNITVYSSAIKFTHLMPGNVCVQAEGMMKPMKRLVLIQHNHGKILQKIKFSSQIASLYYYQKSTLK